MQVNVVFNKSSQTFDASGAASNQTMKTDFAGLQLLKGKDGESAYQIAVDNGFEGTEEEWLKSLEGEDGASGVYVGSGEMPDNCNVQIDPNGEVAPLFASEEWTFTLEDGTVITKRVAII